MTESTMNEPTAWTPMTLRRVGDVGLVMRRKSGRGFDGGQWTRRRKRRRR